MFRSVFAFFIGAFWLLASQSACAGAWPMDAGKGQSITTYSWQGAARGFDGNGKAGVDLGFQKYESAIFLEYGLTSRWTLVARPAVQSVRLRTGDTVDEAQGLGASEIALRRAFVGRGKWVFSGQAGAFLPGDVENGFDKPLGENGIDWEVRALAGHSFNLAGRAAFTDIQLAFRERSRGSSNEIRLDATVGSMVSQRVQVLLQSYTIVGLPSSRVSIRTVNSFKGQISGVWLFKEGRGVQLSFSRTLAGRNVIRDSGVTIGFWRRF